MARDWGETRQPSNYWYCCIEHLNEKKLTTLCGFFLGTHHFSIDFIFMAWRDWFFPIFLTQFPQLLWYKNNTFQTTNYILLSYLHSRNWIRMRSRNCYWGNGETEHFRSHSISLRRPMRIKRILCLFKDWKKFEKKQTNQQLVFKIYQ